MLDFERGSSRSQAWWKSLLKRLWTCLKTGYGMNNMLSNFIPVTSVAEYGSVEVQLLPALDGGEWPA